MGKFLSFGAAGILMVLAVFLYGGTQYHKGYSKSAIDCKNAAIAATKKTLNKQVDAREKFNPDDRTKLIDYLAGNDGLRSGD